MIKPKVVLLIFVSGKIVLTGAKVRSSSLSSYTLGVARAILYGALVLCLWTTFDLLYVDSSLNVFFYLLRLEKKSTLRSTLYTPCFVNSGSPNSPRWCTGSGFISCWFVILFFPRYIRFRTCISSLSPTPYIHTLYNSIISSTTLRPCCYNTYFGRYRKERKIKSFSTTLHLCD